MWLCPFDADKDRDAHTPNQKFWKRIKQDDRIWKPPSGQGWVNAALWALPPCASNRNQACREGFLGAWPGREPIICKRWDLGLSQELPESLLPVRTSLRAAKSACNNRGFLPSPSLSYKPCSAESQEQPNKTGNALQPRDFWGWDCGDSYCKCFLSDRGQRHVKWGLFFIVWLVSSIQLPSVKRPSSTGTANQWKRVRSFVFGESGKVQLTEGKHC